MSRKGKKKAYQLHALDSAEAQSVLALQGVTRAELGHALVQLERDDKVTVRAIIGVNDDGVFGTARDGWTPDLPDAFKEPIIALPWPRIFELLGRAPEASRAGSPKAGSPPG
jgi:hypothetical protein